MNEKETVTVQGFVQFTQHDRYCGVFSRETKPDDNSLHKLEIFSVKDGLQHGLCVTAKYEKENTPVPYYMLYRKGKLQESGKSLKVLMDRANERIEHEKSSAKVN